MREPPGPRLGVKPLRVSAYAFLERCVDKHFELAMELERVTLKDDYFSERKLYPNVAFNSGIIFRPLGLPAMFTPMFAVAHTVAGSRIGTR